jgi:hypothetical protein
LAIPEGASKLSKEQLVDKIRGTIFGAAVGDAVGLGIFIFYFLAIFFSHSFSAYLLSVYSATEFLNKEQSSFVYGREAITFGKGAFPRDRHRGRWLTGDWTDDTDQYVFFFSFSFF